MTPTRKYICKNIARGSHAALARRCLENDEIKKYIIKGVGCILQREVAVLCSNSLKSVLRNKTNGVLKSFNWKCLVDELKIHSPTLLAILKTCTKVPRTNNQSEAVIGVITAILCKNRRDSASLMQRLVSVILYGGHASKKVTIYTKTCKLVSS